MGRPISFLISGTGAEEQLVEGLRRGEVASYRHLYEMFAPRLRCTIERIFRDPQIAHDVVQTTFLIVFRKIDQFDGRSALLTWMTRIAIREAQRLIGGAARWRGAAARPAMEPPPDPPRSPEQENANRELYCYLESLIAALPIEKRTALLLFETEGFSVQEIAEVTGEPRGTVLARLSRTRAELRQAMRRWSDAGALNGRRDALHYDADADDDKENVHG